MPAPVTGPSAFNTLEQSLFEGRRANDGWKELEGAYVLFPKNKEPRAIVHFVGGSIVGAAPQMTYGLFLEALASHGCIVIATGYATNFDHMRCADECQFKFERAYRALGRQGETLPVYGVGHSLGSLLHLLICGRYPNVPRAGNVLMSFNNRPATDSIPLLAPVISPSFSMIAPVISTMASSTTPFRQPLESMINQVKAVSPSLVRQTLPLLEQLQAVYSDLASGRQEFIPAPEECRRLFRSYYKVNRNMLIKFRSDAIDETAELTSMLSNSSAVSDSIDMTVKVMSGDHLRPLSQTPVEIPSQLAAAGSKGAELMIRLSQMAVDAGVPVDVASEVSRVSASVAASLGSTAQGSSASRSPWAGNLEEVADEVCQWMGINDRYIAVYNAVPQRASNQFDARNF